MRRVKSKNTTPERLVRSVAHAMGYRFRLHYRKLPGNSDIVFPARKKVIFVNGCFWHGHACRRARMPESNREFWQSKISRTVARDGKNRRALRMLGWKWLVIWECGLKDRSKLEYVLYKFLESDGKA